MTLTDILPQVEKLSDADKLALIEATAHMLKKTFVDGDDDRNVAAVAEPVDVKQYHIEQGKRKMAALLQELSSRPNPTPDQMLPRGLLKGVIFTEEDFRTTTVSLPMCSTT